MDDEKDNLSFWQIVGSTLAAALGVQSSKNRKRDFEKGKPIHFIVAGIVFTGIFIIVVIVVVNLVLPDAAARETTTNDAPLKYHTVLSDQHPIRVWAKAKPDSRQIILLVHGRTWSARPDFDLQVKGESLSLMDGLVAGGVSTYALDLRGYGETPRDPSGWATPNQSAEDVARVLAWLKAENPDQQIYLFGWSLGSMVSQLTVQKYPELAAGIILFGYPVRPGIMETPDNFPTTPSRIKNTAKAAASDFIVPGSISDNAIAGFVQAALRTDPVKVDWKNSEEWRDLAADKISVPTLLLQGEQDPLALDTVHANFFAQLNTPDKAWVVIAGGDHAAFMETPRNYFVQTILTFVNR